MPGSRIGKVTRRSLCQALAPRSVAASSQERLNRLTTANMANSPNGKVQVSCAPKAELNRLVSQPRNLKPRAMPKPTSRLGITRLATAR